MIFLFRTINAIKSVDLAADRNYCTLGFIQVKGTVMSENKCCFWNSDFTTKNAAFICVVFSFFVIGFFRFDLNNISHVVKTPENPTEAFFHKITHGDAQAIKTMLSQGIDANVRDEKFRTALYVAEATGQTAIKEMLLQHGANPEAKDGSGLEARMGTPINASMRTYLETIDKQVMVEQTVRRHD